MQRGVSLTLPDVKSVNENGASAGKGHTGCEPEQRSLAGSVQPDETDDLSVEYLKLDVLQGGAFQTRECLCHALVL